MADLRISQVGDELTEVDGSELLEVEVPGDPAESHHVPWSVLKADVGGGGVAPLLLSSGGTKSVGLPGHVMVNAATGTFSQGTGNRHDTYIKVDAPITVDAWYVHHASGGGANMRVGIYAADPATLQPTGAPLFDKEQYVGGGDIKHTVSLDTPVTLQAGWYVVSWTLAASATLRFYLTHPPGMWFNPATPTERFRHDASVAFTYGALPTNPDPTTPGGAAPNTNVGLYVLLRWSAA